MRKFLLILGVVVILVLFRLSFYTVDATEYAYVTVLGRHVETHDGQGGGAGLHFGWPWPVQMVQRLDRRLQTFDLPQAELLTPDRNKKQIDKTLSVEAYVVWQIADAAAVERFIQSLGTVDRAQTLLQQRFNSQLGATIGQMNMEDLINKSPGHVDAKMEEIRNKLMKALHDLVLDKYGIQLKDVRLRRFYHPDDIRKAIFARISSERQDRVREIRSKGKSEKEKIDSDTKLQAEAIEEDALAQAKKIRDTADREAARIVTDVATKKDPELYTLVKSLESLEKMFAENKSMVLLSTKHPLFQLLLQTPTPNRPGVNGPDQNPMPPIADPKKIGTDAKKGGV